MRKIDLGSVLLFRNFENNLGSLPFFLVFEPVQIAVSNEPDYFFLGNKFGDFKSYEGFSEMNRENIVQFSGTTLYIFCPPSGYLVDFFKYFQTAFVYQKNGCVILLFHFFSF